MKCIEVQAHAKVNLILNVLGKRPDGYHEIESVMQTIDLHDKVEICCTERGSGADGLEIFLDPGRDDLPAGPDNLAYKAALLMYREFREGARLSIRLRIDKRIPAAA
ncbi:MAG: 4-(cytidine 5'-diphospho)-2-C-methyl-D-erythritol kinase, partial [Clostridiales bacterium]|nr:4-(cytidine 5'-diphospho)-2-C-methyl-D-erythritol kinase [Clostridiales bacterium]